MPTLPPPPPPFFPSTTQVPWMPFVTSIPPFVHSTAPIPTMPLAASIPSMPMSSFQYNGYASNSSQRNGFQSSGHVPPVVQGNTQDYPVAQRLRMVGEKNVRVLALLAKLPGAAVLVDVEPRTGFQSSPFVDEIAMVDVPKKYSIQTFTPKYSGISDPTEHVAQYKQLMWTPCNG
ncbi:hypothetical protein L6452_18916 [Arctium lappa]|uniref:Uncharacterized protein n=1 Tax=Arctium lappa TaxID=4217 RepID=A0ACB9B6T1_ARCLA|nr:hypothetical protein L6452_18916 [Arctium lappa]